MVLLGMGQRMVFEFEHPSKNKLERIIHNTNQMITLIHPSRQRPEKSHQTILKWIMMAENKVEVIVSLDKDDPELPRYKDYYQDLDVRFVTADNRSAVDAINLGAKFAKGDILIVVSDDTDCFPRWDSRLFDQMAGKRDWIMKTKDGIQEWLITMPIMDRTYYNRFGYIYHDAYAHCFCDTELTCVAELTGKLVISLAEFKHNHYSIGKSERDSVSQKADATFESGKKIFIERKKRNFDLKPEQIKGRLSDNVYSRM